MGNGPQSGSAVGAWAWRCEYRPQLPPKAHGVVLLWMSLVLKTCKLYTKTPPFVGRFLRCAENSCKRHCSAFRNYFGFNSAAVTSFEQLGRLSGNARRPVPNSSAKSSLFPSVCNARRRSGRETHFNFGDVGFVFPFFFFQCFKNPRS